jgi:5-methylcytosine-specific restriction endonuclease McrA
VKRKNQPIREAIKKTGVTLKNLEIDHVVPLADGGSDLPSNKQLITKPAHRLKTAVENAARKARKRKG